MSFTKKELAAEAQRELQKRRTHYPNFIRQGKLSQSAADRQTALMEAIYRVLIRLDDADIAQGQL